ncbi:MAG TPA: hypothetical protein VFK05_32250 [Polyangiaceae bacterium]|nr:hypothetical protein [Polyangiaceae bacterium]
MRRGTQCVVDSAGAQNGGSGGNARGNGSSGDGGNGMHPDAGSAGASDNAGMGGEPNGGDGGSAGQTGGDGGGSGGNTAGSGGSSGNTAGSSGSGGSAAGGSGGSDALVTAALDCGSRDVTGATVITNPITQDTTWSGVIHLPNGVSVRNEPTLTIAPGTKVIVGHNASVEFGYLGSHATIVAQGTTDKPIMFCGETDTAGYWSGLIFRSGLKTASVLRNVLIADGGASDAGLTIEMPLLVQGVQVRHSGANGVNAAGFDPASSLLNVSGSTNVALRATAPKGVEVPAGSQLTGNGTDVIDIGFATFDTDLTFRDLGVPYQQLNDLKAQTTAAAPTVIFEPGVVYEVDRQKVLDFGISNVHALGSMAKPVVFQRLPCTPPTSLFCVDTPSPRYDIGGRITAAGLDVRFENVEVRRFGWVSDEYATAQPNGALTLTGNGTLEVDHLKITGASGYGLKVSGSRAFSSNSNSLEVGVSFTYAGLWLNCPLVAGLPDNVKLSSGFTRVECASIETANTTWPAGASPYSVNGLSITSGASLTLPPGATLQFLQATALTIQNGGTLKAVGRPDAGIRFIKDSAANNKWAGIVADKGSTVQLDYILVREAGSNGAAITANTPIQLSHSTIMFSGGVGVNRTATDTTDYVTGNTFTSNVGADVAVLP